MRLSTLLKTFLTSDPLLVTTRATRTRVPVHGGRAHDDRRHWPTNEEGARQDQARLRQHARSRQGCGRIFATVYSLVRCEGQWLNRAPLGSAHSPSCDQRSATRLGARAGFTRVVLPRSRRIAARDVLGCGHENYVLQDVPKASMEQEPPQEIVDVPQHHRTGHVAQCVRAGSWPASLRCGGAGRR